MNFITAVSSTSTESQLSDSNEVFETSDTKVSEETTTLTRLETSSTSAPTSPKARSRRRSWQSKTSYHLAHPPPSTTLRRRFKLRPRIILQLQQVSGTQRPIPVLDVFPSVLFAPRLARKAPSILQHKHGLGLDDLVIVQSQDRVPAVATQNESSEYEDGGKATETAIIAAICRSHPTERNGQCRTEIRFDHDATWTATALSNGAYEFVSNGCGETQSIARWVPKRETGKGGSAGNRVQNFKFSLIDTKSRRHPVIANMNRHSIDVYDRYSIPSSPQHSYRHTDAESVESVEMEHSIDSKYGECDEPCRKAIETDEHLRTMIAITGIWVGFCEGWSPNFKYSTTQVISNGISELSNRRRSSAVTLTSQSIDAPCPQQLESEQRTQCRPDVLHTFSLPSIPSSASLSLPTATPRRMASTTTTLFGDYKDHVDRQICPIVSDSGSDIGYRKRRRASGTGPTMAAKSSPGAVARDRDGQTEQLYLQNSLRSFEGGSTQGREAVGSVKKPGRFKNLFDHLRRTSSIR
ncbi:MAG: hypothetical protein Q9201_003719 [Fulgogasparrea decipioides]